MRRKRRLRVLTLGVLLAALPAGLLAACSAPPVEAGPQVTELTGWLAVELPEDFWPVSLTADQTAVWVGGRTVDPREPRLARLDAADSDRPRAQAVPLRPVSPYAKNAELVSLAVRGDEVSALGGVRDGAHSNVRWSVWSGTARALREFPQGFNTFGGPEAGDLVGIVHPDTTPDAGPVIVGTWSSRHGLDAAAWIRRGDRFERQPASGTVLASSATEQNSPRTAISDGSRVVVLGSVLELGPDIRQVATAWTWPSRNEQWARGLLPDAGRRSEALAASCHAETCWVFGQVDDRAAAWTTDSAGRRRVADLPVSSLRTSDGAAAFRVSGHVGAVFSDGVDGRLLLQTDRGWRLFSTPAGTAGPAAAVGNRIYVVVEDGERTRLWSCDLADARGN